VVQVALSTVLIVGALLFARSLQNLVTVDPGFNQDGLLSVNVDIRRSNVDEKARLATYAQIMDRVRTIPGVSSAAETYIVPMSGSGWNQNLIVDGQKQQEPVFLNRVGPDFFKTMGTPLLAGRMFNEQDRLGSLPAAIVNETFVKKYLGGAHPVGRTFQLEGMPGEPQPAYHIVGLVKDTKYYELREEAVAIGYFPMAQEAEGFAPFPDVIVRTDLPLASLTPGLTRSIREITPNATVAYEPLRTYIRDSLVTERLMASLSGFFGLLAMLIASVGLYGVMSYMVSRRRVEIGIRMALGAEPGSVIRMVLRESGLLVVIGVIAGTALAVFASRWAASLLFGLKPWDPLSIAAAVIVLGTVSLMAAWIPARRASRVAPTVALRAE
jgi:predicted permease